MAFLEHPTARGGTMHRGVYSMILSTPVNGHGPNVTGLNERRTPLNSSPSKSCTRLISTECLSRHHGTLALAFSCLYACNIVL